MCYPVNTPSQFFQKQRVLKYNFPRKVRSQACRRPCRGPFCGPRRFKKLQPPVSGLVDPPLRLNRGPRCDAILTTPAAAAQGTMAPKVPPGALQIGDYAHEALKHIRQHAHGACECLCPRTPSLYRVAASQKRHPELPPTYRPLISADFLVQMMVAKGYRGIADPHYRRTPCSKWCGGACWGPPT